MMLYLKFSVIGSYEIIGQLQTSVMGRLCLYVVVLISIFMESRASSLYPYESETREIRSLDGLWVFRTSPPENEDLGFKESWYNKHLEETGPTRLMPVPSSFNDVSMDVSLRDYVGWVWYQRLFYVPNSWLNNEKSINIRFGSVHYHAMVWVNGRPVGEHVGGHLPFLLNINKALDPGMQLTRLTVAVNNTLTNVTLPQMQIYHYHNNPRYPENYIHRKQGFDYFNYAGIHRPVLLMALPRVYISDITVDTSFLRNDDFVFNVERSDFAPEYTGLLHYDITPSSPVSSFDCKITIIDRSRAMVAERGTCKGNVLVDNANLWWPRNSHPDPGYLYTLQVELSADGHQDLYRLPFGFRTITWNETRLFINDKPTYLYGFGMHEDSILRGKGLDLVHLVRDFDLIKWFGANTFRTSNYPYSEEAMNMADKLGIMVIEESPASMLTSFVDDILKHHRQVMSEIIARDKNRPSVVLWSLGNAPSAGKTESEPYFKGLAEFVRSLDKRPITFSTTSYAIIDKASRHMDIVCVNRYKGWYQETGHLDLIKIQTIFEIKMWQKTHMRPIMMSEFGAGSFTHEHESPAMMYSQDYQVQLLKRHFEAFDDLSSILAGELIWNFQDFKTNPDYKKPSGNRKGLVTRERQPKMAAHLARWRFHQLSNREGINSGNDSDDAYGQLGKMLYT